MPNMVSKVGLGPSLPAAAISCAVNARWGPGYQSWLQSMRLLNMGCSLWDAWRLLGRPAASKRSGRMNGSHR